MAYFQFSELLNGTKQLAVKVYNSVGELFTSANPGYVNVQNELPVGDNVIGKIIPVDTDGDEKFTSANPAIVQLSGSILAEQKTQADALANTITFTGDINAVEIYHEESTWQTFTVNGIALTIPAGGYRTPIAGTVAKTVTIPTGVNCIVGRLS